MTALRASGAAQSPAFFTLTYVEVVPPSADQASSLLTEYREASSRDYGTASVELMQRLHRRNQFVVVAAWTVQEAFESHLRTAHLGRLNRELAPLLAAPTDTRQHTGLAVGAGRAGGVRSLNVVTHVDVTPPNKDDAEVALRQFADDSRRQAGNLRFDVWQQTNRPNHFSVVETWSSRRAFEAHGMASQTKDFRTKLAIMTGALYDERLYKTLS